MRLELTTDAAANWAAKQWLGYQYPLASEKERAARLNVVKFNVLATAFNVSTVMLTAAVALAIFSTAASAVVWGGIGLALRFIAEKEIERYGMPPLSSPSSGKPESYHREMLVTRAVMWLLPRTERAPKDREDCILERCGIDKSYGNQWDENEAIFLDYIIWKNPLPVTMKG